MTKVCDNTSVGVVLRDEEGNLALLKRGRFPVGIAPAAGHIDDHGSPEQAAVDEVFEEIGVTLEVKDLSPLIVARDIPNVCRRPNGDHHVWTVYAATVPTGTIITPDKEQTKGARWYTAAEVAELAQRTRAYRHGDVPEESWQQDPGLEEIWLDFLTKLDVIEKEAAS